LLCLFLAQCGFFKADVAGDVFVTMKSGDVKRGAGIEVFIVPDTAEFRAEWDKMVASGFSKWLGIWVRSVRARPEYIPGPEHLANAMEIYGAAAEKVVRRFQPQVVRTDINGHYEGRGLRRGPYFVFARFSVSRENLAWMVPLDLTSGSRKLDLASNNQGLPSE
jgi:hypothetical protein